MRRLDGKVAIVTGGSAGIGKAIALGMAKEGANIVLTARSADKLEAVAREIADLGVETETYATDIADEAGVTALFDLTMRRFGRVDLLVNNAGSFEGGPIDEMSIETWDRVMGTNLRGPFLCTRAAIRIMKPQGGGRIINIGSISAKRVRHNTAPYSTTKHGLWGLTQVTALEGREHNITCGCLHPGNVMVERRLTSKREQDSEPMIDAADLAEVAVLMAALPAHVEMLEAIVLPKDQLYVGRG